jgi:cytochrome c-type biogenesis protein CcmH
MIDKPIYIRRPEGAAEGSQGQTAKPCRPWKNLNDHVRALLRARRNRFYRAPSGRGLSQATVPGAARYALAPGYHVPRPWRSVVLATSGLLLTLSILLSAGRAMIAKEAQSAEDPQIEQRMRAMTQQLRCLVCQNETLADSQADLAADLRQQIREQMKAGKSDQEIIAFLTQRYGDFVLYKPPVKATTYLLWFGPFALLLMGIAVLYRYLKRRRELIHDQPLTADERRRAEELLRTEVG